MSKKPASSTSRIYAHSMADGLRRHQVTTRTPTKTWPVRRGHANTRPPKAEKVMRRCLGGCRCNIDDTAVCFADYCSMLTRVLQALFCFCCRRERSAKRVIVLWALGRVTAPHAHRTARPMHMASIDSLRMTAVENRAHATAAAATTAAVLVARAWSTIFSTYISHRSHVFFSFL